MKSKNQFFTVMPVGDALALLHQEMTLALPIKTLTTADAVGHILAEDTHSPIDLPNFVRSTMDGYAVRAEDTFGASDSLPAYLRKVGVVHMGEVPDVALASGDTAEIHTGAMLPQGADAVVMVERTQNFSDEEVEVLAPVAPGENLVQIGEDVKQGAVILPKGHTLRPQDVGGLLAVGITEIQVMARPKVGIVSCGDELVSPEVEPQMGQIRDINAYTLGALFTQAGAEVLRAGIAEDNYDALYTLASETLAQCDMLVMTAGSSVSVRDLTRDVINKLGEPGVLQHGLAVKPGKPAMLAVADGKPVIGLPGNPVSAMLVARQTVLPTLRKMLGQAESISASKSAILTQNIASTTGREDTIPVRLEERDSVWYATPLFGKSNLIYTLVNADGLVTVPLNEGGIKAQTQVTVQLF
jgi:molybdopterin molybdotransferase